MEIQSINNKAISSSSSRLKFRKQKISLEHYIDFLSSHKELRLTVNMLNQIIFFHGFKKLMKVPKQSLIDAVEALDLIDPSRSTLKCSSISSNTWLTEEEMIRDLELLEWQECCITSIQSLNSSSLHDHQQSIPEAKARGKSKKKRSSKAVDTVAEGADSLSSALVSFNHLES